MAEKNNATCAICGEPYYVCMSCRDSLKINPWKVHTDTANCYKVYQVVHGLSTGVYAKDEARDKFKNIDLRNLNSFRPHIKKIIKDILKDDKTVTEVKMAIESEVATEENMIKNTVVEDIVKIEKPEDTKTTYTRKRNYKVEVE